MVLAVFLASPLTHYIAGPSSRRMAGSGVMRSALVGPTLHAGMGGKVLAKEPCVAACCLQMRHA